MTGRMQGWWARPRAWPSLCVALVLALQVLIPGAAVASNHGPFVVCTQAGAALAQAAPARADHKQKGFGGLACEQCVMASLAAVSTPPPAIAAPAELIERTEPPPPAATPPRVRAPPRPYSQGPPRFS